MSLVGRRIKVRGTAHAVTKALLNQAAGIDRLDHHLNQEIDSLAWIADGRDFAEGLDAFLGKRPAAFAGR